MSRREEARRLLQQLGDAACEAARVDCPEERRRALRREAQALLVRLEALEDERLREETAARYPEEDE